VLEYRILGRLIIRGPDGNELTISRPIHRALLCILLVYCGEVVPKRMLSHALWDDLDMPENPEGSLRSVVYRVRKEFKSSELIGTHPIGYYFHFADGDFFDLLAFRKLVAGGRRASSNRDYVQAERLFGEAVSLWRAATLADFPDTQASSAICSALLEDRTLALEELIDAKLALGKHREVVPDLAALTAADSLRESWWSRLMLALYLSGRQADALEAFIRARTALSEEFGVEPGPVLQDLQRRILDKDPFLAEAPTEWCANFAKAPRVPRGAARNGNGAGASLPAGRPAP
jgi:DNA-binding SARP family transcriptional activator